MPKRPYPESRAGLNKAGNQDSVEDRANRSFWTKSWIWITLDVASWGLFRVFWPLSVLTWMSGVVIASRQSRWRGVLTFLTAPMLIVPVVFFFWGIGTYFSGPAQMWMIGRPGNGDFWNLDPELRCYWRSSGCVVTGAEFFWQQPNNAGVRLMVDHFGPVPRHYHGKYPTRAHTWSLVKNPDKILTPEEFLIEATTRKLAVVQREWEFTGRNQDKPQNYKVVDVGSDSVIVAHGSRASVFDRTTGLIFATYWRDGSEE